MAFLKRTKSQKQPIDTIIFSNFGKIFHMDTASFSGLLRTLMYIILFYYAFKFLARLFLPVLLKKVVEKASENMRNTQPNQNQPNSKATDTAQAAAKPKSTRKVGEYIDFEEVE